jgi:hypothetical protein
VAVGAVISVQNRAWVAVCGGEGGLLGVGEAAWRVAACGGCRGRGHRAVEEGGGVGASIGRRDVRARAARLRGCRERRDGDRALGLV